MTKGYIFIKTENPIQDIPIRIDKKTNSF